MENIVVEQVPTNWIDKNPFKAIGLYFVLGISVPLLVLRINHPEAFQSQPHLSEQQVRAIQNKPRPYVPVSLMQPGIGAPGIDFQADEIHLMRPITVRAKSLLLNSSDMVWVRVTAIPSIVEEVKDESHGFIGYRIVLTDPTTKDVVQLVSGDMVLGFMQSSIHQEVLNQDYLKDFRPIYEISRKAQEEKKPLSFEGVVCDSCAPNQMVVVPHTVRVGRNWSYSIFIRPDHDQII